MKLKLERNGFVLTPESMADEVYLETVFANGCQMGRRAGVPSGWELAFVPPPRLVQQPADGAGGGSEPGEQEKVA